VINERSACPHICVERETGAAGARGDARGVMREGRGASAAVGCLPRPRPRQPGDRAVCARVHTHCSSISATPRVAVRRQVTHAVGNTIKRVVIIVASVIAFKTPISTLGVIGSSIAIAGTLLYSLAKNKFG